MQSPYDSVLRIQQRTLDTIRIALSAEIARQQAVSADIEALDAGIENEAAIAASNWQFAAHPYSVRRRADRARLEQDRVGIDARLDRLRDATMEACSQKQAVANAAAGFVADVHLREAGAEQTRADDFTGGRAARARRQPAMAGG